MKFLKFGRVVEPTSSLDCSASEEWVYSSSVDSAPARPKLQPSKETRIYVDGNGNERIVPLRGQNFALRRLAELMESHKNELGFSCVWIEPDLDGYDEIHFGWKTEVEVELYGEVDDGHEVLSISNSCT